VRPRQSFRFGRGRMSRTLSSQGQQSHMRLNRQYMYQHASAEDFTQYARVELTRMDARLTFFALEDLSRTVLVTSETAVLRGAITCRRRWCGRNRPVGLWRQSPMLNTGTHVPMEEHAPLRAWNLIPQAAYPPSFLPCLAWPRLPLHGSVGDGSGLRTCATRYRKHRTARALASPLVPSTIV